MRFKVSYIVVITAVVMISLLEAACKKTRVLTVGGTLTFSVDTLKFDTVFTAAGSYTNGLLIYNTSNEEMILSSVRLQNPADSYFHLNVDGFAGNNVPNLKIAPHDSLYVFATVNINPNSTLTPFLVTDSLVATLNGRNFYVPFTAYGQNAHYIISDSLIANVKWLTDKPYVIIHSCEVGPGVTLTIPPNCKVYLHQDARIFVYGTLNVGMGGTTGKDSVVMQGDRLDRAYFGYIGYPGEWGGLDIVPGGQAFIHDAIIKNCGGATAYWAYAIQPAAIEVDTEATLTIDHSIVENSIGFGILGFAGSVTATNCLVNLCGAQCLGVVQGGYDSITNCTFVNYGSAAVSHISNPAVGILNYLSNGDGTWNPGSFSGVMRNCIVYGSLDSELYCDSLGGATAALLLDHCLFGTGFQIEHFVHTTGCIIGQAPNFTDPMFKNPANGDFHLLSGSKAIGAGAAVPSVTDDLEGNPWNNNIGCYQNH